MQRKYIYIYGLNLSYIYIYLYLENIKLQNDVRSISAGRAIRSESSNQGTIGRCQNLAHWANRVLEYIAGWWLSHPMKNMKSVGISIPNLWKNKKCSKY